MDVASEKQRRVGRFAFWRRKEAWLVISGFHAGDIHSEQPVLIQPEATVVGNVFAPRITIGGLLNGSLIAQKTTVEAKGQIWGDVYTISLEVNAGGKIQGWITTLDDDTYPQLQANGTIPNNQSLVMPTGNGDNMLDLNVRPPSSNQIFALRYLQSEAATALAARAELEQAFEKRLTEVAGETSAKVQSLHENLDAARATLNEVRLQHAEAEETIRQRNNRLDRQSKELSTTRALLTDHNRELANLRQTSSGQQNDIANLQTTKKQLEQSVIMLQEQLAEATNRAVNLEGALQNNVQYSAEQEESLIHWQELAQVRENELNELKSKLAQVEIQLAEGAQVNEILREQRQQLENEWEQALNELDELREAQFEQAEAPAAASEELQAALLAAETAVEKASTQLLWQKTNYQALQETLEQTRQLAQTHGKELIDLQAVLVATQSQNEADRDKIRAGFVKQQQAFEQELRQVRQEAEQQKQQFQTILQEANENLNKSEAAMDDYYQQVHYQGQELAESRVALVEKDIELQSLQETVEKQTAVTEKVKQQAVAYIQKLQQKLAQTERQVRDLTRLLERKTKK
ncbi:MAG: polymer-forming cytoskeletal protein [Chloroflexota bacterium]